MTRWRSGKAMGGMKVGAAALLAGALAACTSTPPPATSAAPLALELVRRAPGEVEAVYRARRPVAAIHFARRPGPYRAEQWRAGDAFRWVSEPGDERIERIDGRPFDRVAFAIPIRYRPLPKDYGPFSPFSEGSTLIYSGQFHACPAAPCEEAPPLPVTVLAKGETVGVGGARRAGRARFVSRGEGTNIFVGTLEPVRAEGFVGIVDPGLPPQLRDRLAVSLPRAMSHFAQVHGPLSFTPELYVSIDERPAAGGNVSTQGGVLPRQVFMHFDGADPRRRAGADAPPLWLEWFFAHEAAHLFQQDKSGADIGEETTAWLHEGGADAMAALALAGRGAQERAYARTRLGEAEEACGKRLAAFPLDAATARGEFDLHYQCGLVIWLALDVELRAGGHTGLDGFTQAFFARVREGAGWSPATFLALARERGASAALLGAVEAVTAGEDPAARQAAFAALGARARQSLADLS